MPLTKRFASILSAVVLAFSFLFVASETAYAQLGTSGLRGRVTDATSAVIGGAKVTIKNNATGQVRETVSSEDGLYAIESLSPGEYSIKIEAPSFRGTSGSYRLYIGEIATVNAKLDPAATQDVVEVVGGSDRVTVNRSSAELAGVITENAITNLPLNGRNFLDLGLLLPGNGPTPVFDSIKANTSLLSSVGQSARTNNIAIDGADNNDDFFGGTALNFPIDSIREFQIVNGVYDADKGRSSSSVVNIITKGGSNEYHGTTSFFFRNDTLSALPATLDRGVLNQLGEPPFDRQQYAATFGGPLRRDRVFFFTGFEYRDQDSIAFAGRRDLAQRRVLTTFVPTELRDLLLTPRVDLNLNRDQMFFRYGLQRQRFVDTASLISPTGNAESLSEVENNFQSFVYNWVRTISPRLVNDFSFSLIDSENRRDSPLANAQDRPEFTRPLIQEGPPAHEIPFGVDQHRVQFRNNVSLLAGAHNIKFGGEFQIVNDSAFDRSFRSGVVSLTESFPTQDRNRDGKIDDNDTPVFLSLRVRAANNGNIPDIDNKYLGLYFQDSWQVTKRFTLSLGVRYELDNNINNRRDQAQVDPAIAAAFPQEPRRDKNNFAPRVGFNWDVLGDGSTVVRGGYGISYSRVLLQSGLVDRTSGLNINELRLGSILDEAGNFLPNDPTPSNPFTGILIASFASNLAVSDPRLVNPYTQQFTFGVQREIVRDLVLSVDGLHTLGLKFIGRKNISVDPIIFAAVSSLKNNYDALLVKLEKRANRFNFIAAYTLSKASSQTQDDQGPPFADMVSDVTRKAPPANDVRNRFSFAGVVGLPLGLRFSSILTLESDPPFDILLSDFSRLPFVQINAGGRQFRNGRELNAFISQLNNAGGANGAPIPLVRDDLKFGDSFASMDLRVTKNFKITERLSLEAIAEGFNIFNVTNVRGSQLSGGAGGGFSGFQNVLVRDSEDPRDPGFLRSSTFGNKLQTAGGVFGTGGPRSFQFAIKLAF